MKNNLSISTELVATLTQEQRQNLARLWNKRVLHPLAFIPHDERAHVTPEEAESQNASFGVFSTSCLKEVLGQTSKRERYNNLYSHKRVVAAGYGRGYDSNWLKEAATAGLKVLWIDVSDVATDWAWKDLQHQAGKARAEGIEVPGINVWNSELHAALRNPGMRLDLEKVKGWFAARTLGCLSKQYKQAVPEVLRIMGQSISKECDSEKTNWIVLVNAFREDNPGHQGRTSDLPRLTQVEKCLREGANREVKLETWGSYRYFTKHCRAIIASAR